MTARHRDLDNLAHRLDRAATIVPQVLDHLDEQRANVAAIAARDYSTPHGSGGIANPTLRTTQQLEAVEYRRRTIKDCIDTLNVCVKMLEQECRTALAFRVSLNDDSLDHLDGAPRCIGAGAGITTHCEQIPEPRPDGQGSRIDDGRCLDCGRRYDDDQAQRVAGRRQRRAQNDRVRYHRAAGM